jgi:hypothetical protein
MAIYRRLRLDEIIEQGDTITHLLFLWEGL